MLCVAADCNKPPESRGFCSRHYQQLRAHEVVGPRSYKCGQCGENFFSEHKKVYCSKSCNWTAQKRKAGVKPLAVYKAETKNPTNWFACEQCGIPSHRGRSTTNIKSGVFNRFCSKACNSAWRTAQGHKSPKFTALHFSFCPHCEAPFRSKSGAKYCSSTCIAEAGSLDRLREHKELATVTTCLDCDLQWCRLYGICGPFIRCTDCQAQQDLKHQRMARKRQKALRRGLVFEKVDDYEILDRDRWTCQLCGCKTPKAMRGTYKPNAPEVDHIIPASKGGATSYANLQCACRRCNLDKSDRIRGQFRLF